ncbi:WecB/TagA/CpsF family glycosyltransferase [Mycobacterium sp. 1423905.2]|uniref:WecB/TagA/CpsF family glycosyltransferase n=1 Tax=Mycobacterium sp. 1423905.2 TaxID=1856859 RepID=UPI000800B22D|nr:WecB/TagA/CpsF family glycosyltransferase [Mycobacterium sp. 1423905.2]OBJ54190.1 teichoic acid biosynthesis protein [Mycobacterium sp. 1423905.2]
MAQHTLPSSAVRMVVSGSIVERCETDEVLSIIKSRLAYQSSHGLAVGSVNLDHLHHFRSVGAAPNGQLEWLLLADGMPIAWRGQLLTAQPWPRVTGADLLPAVLELAEQHGHRVGFLGGSAETHSLLKQQLPHRFPALCVSGMWAPSAADLDLRAETLVSSIRAADTDILIVSLGKPRQEQWVDQYGYATGAQVFLPCGGAIDFLAGTTRRAPRWMQRAGLEWLYRLTREPRRLARRYLVQGPIALLRAARAQLICYPGVYYAGTIRGHVDTGAVAGRPA